MANAGLLFSRTLERGVRGLSRPTCRLFAQVPTGGDCLLEGRAVTVVKGGKE